MIRSILKYGDRVVHDRAEPVGAFTPDIDRLVGDMIETMYAAPGVGLAAPQVGVPLRIFVVDISIGRDPSGLIVMINPEFVEQDGLQLEEEGCLSVPGFNATVARPTRAVIKGLDRTGVEQQLEGSALLARAFQHEMDHLDGRLFVDRLRGIKAAYGELRAGAVLATPRLGLVNVHALLLPRQRGAAPVHRAVIAGDSETGITIMRIVKALDAGPMLAAAKRPIQPDETSDV